MNSLYGHDTAAFLGNGDDVDDDSGAWLVDGLVPAALPSMMFGKVKSKKSLLAYYLAICIAAGEPALGRDVTRARVLVISREDGERETRRRLWQIARGLGVDLAQLVAEGWLHVDARQPLYLDRPADVAALGKSISSAKIKFVVIDSLSRVNGSDEDSRSSMAAVTNAWNDLCSALACGIMLLHHEVKNSSAPLLDRIRGTGDIAAVLRVAIGVKKVDQRVSKLEVDGNLPNLATALVAAFDDRETDGQKQIVVSSDTTPAPKMAGNRRDIRAKVLGAFDAEDSYPSRNAIVDAARVCKKPGLAMIKMLIGERALVEELGLIRRVEVTS